MSPPHPTRPLFDGHSFLIDGCSSQCPTAIKLTDAFGKRTECVTEFGRSK